MKLFALGSAAVLAIGVSCSASAAQIDKFAYNNWQGGAYTDDRTNSFTTCSVSASYMNGSVLVISMGAGYATNLGFFYPQWMLKPGTPISGDLRIDNRYFSQFKGSASGPQFVSIPFGISDPVFEALRLGTLLLVNSNVGSAQYNLRDTARALDLVRACVDKYRSLAKPNPELAAWVARNPWFGAPQFRAQSQTANAIDAQLIAEGIDPTTRPFYDELDRRLSAAGIGASGSSVASVTAPPPANTPAPNQPALSGGTGFVVSTDGRVVTSLHVVSSCTGPILVTTSTGQNHTAEVLSRDDTNDLALLSSDFKTQLVAILRSTPVQVGESVITAGYPDFTPDFNVTNGVVSALAGLTDTRLVQISAPVNPGNSGGPLLDQSGNVIGIVEATKADAQNTNFAFKGTLIRDFLERNFVPYRATEFAMPLDTTEVANRARLFTVRLVCPTKAATESK